MVCKGTCVGSDVATVGPGVTVACNDVGGHGGPRLTHASKPAGMLWTAPCLIKNCTYIMYPLAGNRQTSDQQPTPQFTSFLVPSHCELSKREFLYSAIHRRPPHASGYASTAICHPLCLKSQPPLVKARFCPLEARGTTKNPVRPTPRRGIDFVADVQRI